MSAQIQVPRPRLRTTDAVLSAETTAHNAAMMGRAWVGALRAGLEKLSATDRSIAVDELQRGLASFARNLHSGSMRTGGGFGSLGTGASERPEEVFDVGGGADPADINASNAAFWADGNRSATRDAARHDLSTGATPATIMAASKKFWMSRTGAPVSQGTRDAPRSRGGEAGAIATINRQNSEFWSQQTAHQKTEPKRWGQA